MRSANQSYFTSFDSTQLFYRYWPAYSKTQLSENRKAIIVMHRGHEHSGRLQDIVDSLNLEDYWAFAYDARGHGRSPGPRGYADDFSTLTKDLDTFVKFISIEYGISVENMVVVANSVGAVVTTAWVHDYAPRIRAMVLAAPAFRVKLYVPFALAGLRLLDKIKRPAFISSYVKSKMLTHDTKEAQAYNEDPLITRDIAVNILLGLYDAATRVVNNAGAITTPTLVLSAGRDFVVELGVQKKFFQGLASAKKAMHVFPKFFHGVFYEKDRREVFAMAREFILEAMKTEVARNSLLDAHISSPSKVIFDELEKPVSFFKGLMFGFQTVMMHTLGRLSRGVQIGLKYGFDSGLSLDYVYENNPRGITPLGKLIDYFYLQAVGWKGIRLRKINIENMIEKAITTLKSQGQSVRIMDIAGGPGRYLLDMALQYSSEDLQIVVRDNVHANLEHGRYLANQMHIQNVRYEYADAFQTKKMGDFQPNIVIVSGFFELFGDNDLIRRCIDQIARESAPNAILIYTGQPYHPQQEMIARTLNNRDGKEWVMRLRSQAEMDELFRVAGFMKQDMSIDPYGIFTVSLAEKIPMSIKVSKEIPTELSKNHPSSTLDLM